jgi:hypothetical protein
MRRRQSGQVVFEMLVVLLLLTVLIGAQLSTARDQFRWVKSFLGIQVHGQSLMLGHAKTGSQAAVARSSSDSDTSINSVMRQYQIGQDRWWRVNDSSHPRLEAWRLLGAGQASSDREITQRLSKAPGFWSYQSARSQTVIRRYRPTLETIDAPWRARGSMSEWLLHWEGRTPARGNADRPVHLPYRGRSHDH